MRLDIQLRPEEAAVVLRALDAVIERAGPREGVSAETRPAPLRRVDALVAMAEGCLAGGAAGDNAGPPVELIVHVEGAGGTLADGTALPPATVARLACDAAVVEVVEDARGTALDVGRPRRTIPTLLRRALRLRDRGCRFPGCTNRRVDGHHVVPWSQGGPTALGNLCSLCRPHHGYVHELGFRLEGDGHGAFRFYDPAGRELPAAGAPPAIAAAALDVIRARTIANGIAIDAETNLPTLDDRGPDYGHIVACLAATAVGAGAGAMRAVPTVSSPGDGPR